MIGRDGDRSEDRELGLVVAIEQGTAEWSERWSDLRLQEDEGDAGGCRS